MIKANFSLESKIEKSKLIWKKIESLKVFQDSKIVMLYWSMSNEVFTHEFILKWVKSKRIILPSVQGDVLILKEFNGFQNMKVGESFGILEPQGMDFMEINSIDLIIVPGVAFDIKNNRMGRGKAYYDKLLLSTKAYKLGVCFDFQLFKKIPVDEFDVKMDKIITD
ncbi:MAG: 5-formyltetrahydrofolate cyclo-ligase [Bacteroidetes bacterium GWF2_33_38]|nr:MAG: 5-formyltetrahydrofolate cyclo-ligase [Bacteroidetes bacterium GWF2_33_38]OFY91882.1 MAG: 5-formyltetrahydrofolate cyclo-ligase [Bacteroidetes bacterium RIFOXYA2_FULL_33_7]